MAVGQEAQLRVIQSSPRGTAVPLYRRCTHLPGASLFVSREEARRSEKKREGAREPAGPRGLKRGTWGGREREDVSAGFPAATYGNAIRAFRRMLSCVFALLRNRLSRVRVTLVHPDKGNQCQCALSYIHAPDAESENAEIMIECM